MALAMCGAALGCTAGTAAGGSVVGPYFTAPFQVTRLPYRFSQDPSFPHASTSSDKPTIPAVLAAYLARWSSDLAALGRLSNTTFTADPLTRLGLG